MVPFSIIDIMVEYVMQDSRMMQVPFTVTSSFLAFICIRLLRLPPQHQHLYSKQNFFCSIKSVFLMCYLVDFQAVCGQTHI